MLFLDLWALVVWIGGECWVSKIGALLWGIGLSFEAIVEISFVSTDVDTMASNIDVVDRSKISGSSLGLAAVETLLKD